MMLPIASAILESLFGDLETLKQKCQSLDDPESSLINGTLCAVTEFLKTNETNVHVSQGCDLNS